MKHFRTDLIKRHKIFSIFITLFAVYFLYSFRFILFLDKHAFLTMTGDITCYDTPDSSNITSSKSLQSLDGTSNKSINSLNKTIFFLETSCKGGLNTRQACSVESASRANPQWQIIVLVTGPLSANFLSAKSYLKLASMGNIRFLRINVTEFSKGTPIQSLFSKHVLNNSDYPIVHASDILRILTLHQFGGVYLDLDVIVVKSFDTLPKNFVTKESEKLMSNGIMALTNDGIGKKFTDIALRELAVSFNPRQWSDNGPALVMRTLSKICKPNDIRHMSADTCAGVAVFDSEYFYPIPWTTWRKYYEEQHIQSSDLYPQTYTYHVWNALGYNTIIAKKSLFARLASKYCPSVYESYENEFGSLGY